LDAVSRRRDRRRRPRAVFAPIGSAGIPTRQDVQSAWLSGVEGHRASRKPVRLVILGNRSAAFRARRGIPRRELVAQPGNRSFWLSCGTVRWGRPVEPFDAAAARPVLLAVPRLL